MFLLLAMIVTTACGSSQTSKEEEKDIKKADEAVYDFIVAHVEGDDDLFKEVLMEDAQGILEDGHHAHPGISEEMGERYEIKRYENHLKDGKLYYYIKFYRPVNGEMDHRNVLMVKDQDGEWRSTTLMGIDRDKMRSAMGDEEPTVVHKMKGDEGDE